MLWSSITNFSSGLHIETPFFPSETIKVHTVSTMCFTLSRYDYKSWHWKNHWSIGSGIL